MSMFGLIVWQFISVIWNVTKWTNRIVMDMYNTQENEHFHSECIRIGNFDS